MRFGPNFKHRCLIWSHRDKFQLRIITMEYSLIQRTLGHSSLGVWESAGGSYRGPTWAHLCGGAAVFTGRPSRLALPLATLSPLSLAQSWLRTTHTGFNPKIILKRFFLKHWGGNKKLLVVSLIITDLKVICIKNKTAWNQKPCRERVFIWITSPANSAGRAIILDFGKKKISYQFLAEQHYIFIGISYIETVLAFSGLWQLSLIVI